jgi:cobyric acid synthase
MMELSATKALLRWAGLAEPQAIQFGEQREATIDYLANHLELCMDINFITELVSRQNLR